MIQEVLAHRGQILAAQAFLLLEFVLAVRKAATLLFLAVFTVLAVQPEAAQLGLDLLLPAVLHLAGWLGHGGEGGVLAAGGGVHVRVLLEHDGGRVEGDAARHFKVVHLRGVVVAACGRQLGAVGDGVVVALLHLLEGQGRHF